MEIFGGFMVMMSILSFFMAVVWLIMPFVVFTIKGKLDRTLDVLAGVEKRLAAMEEKLSGLQNPPPNPTVTPAAETAEPHAGGADNTPDIEPGT
jgi:hypothetical protein